MQNKPTTNGVAKATPPPRVKQAYHVGAGSKLHEQDEQRVPEVASKQGVAYSDKEVEEVGGHERSEQANAHRVGMNLHVHQLLGEGLALRYSAYTEAIGFGVDSLACAHTAAMGFEG